MNRLRLLCDAGVAAGLIFALAAVFLLDRSTSDGDTSGGVEVVEVTEGVRPRSRRLRLAVTRPEHDDMGKLLRTLGDGYRYSEIMIDDLLEAQRLKRYDVLFLTCGEVPAKWWPDRRLMAKPRGSSAAYYFRPKVAERIKASLREYVGSGGTLYASDWRLDFVAAAFPEFIDEARLASGAEQTLEAEVVDPGLVRLLGPSIELRFDKPAWMPAAFVESKVTAYLRGTYKTSDELELSGPLLIRFPFEKGNVIYTSFHNEEQNSETELELLRYLVFATVTARTEARIKETMLSGGFSPAEGNLLSASDARKSIVGEYDCPGKRELRFALGFDDRGAELRLDILSPGGRKFAESGSSTFSNPIAEAEAGRWKYTVTPLNVPYEHFPFTLTIGEKGM